MGNDGSAGRDVRRERSQPRAETRERRIRGPLLALLLTLASPLLPVTPIATPASAQSLHAFDVAAGDLGSVLTQIGRASGQTISFPADLTQGRSAGPIIGQMSVGEAVARALAGSGLTAITGAHGSLIIRRQQAAASTVPAAGSDTLAAIDVADLVGGTGDRGFRAGNTGTSDRLNIPLKEDPRSVVGVTREVIQAQGLTSILDAARNVSNVGVRYGEGQGEGVPSYTIRGFENRNVMVGGRVAPRGVNVPIQDVERVDIIKGPTTDLTGVSLFGGGINITPKVPGPDPIREASVYLGSRFYRTLAFDLGGPVEDAEGLTYRVNVSGNTADTAPGGVRAPHEGLVSPKVRWDDGETTVTTGIRYFDQIGGLGTMTVGNPGFGYRPTRVSRDRPVGTPDAGGSFRTLNPYIDIEHRFGALGMDQFGTLDFTVRNRTSYFASNFTSSGYILEAYQASAGLVRPLGNYTSETSRKAVSQSDLIVVHELGDYRQTMRFGFDYTSQYLSYMNMIAHSNVMFDPRMPPSVLTLPSRFNPHKKTYTDSDDLGIAFQDKIDLFDRLHIIGSVRGDFYNVHETYSFKSNIYASRQEALTYIGGAILDVTKWLSVYGTVGTGFIPMRGVLANGQSAPPQFGNLAEYGAKFSLFDDRFIITAARFEHDNNNALTYDPALHGNVLGPGTATKGGELDVQGQLTENISLIGGVGYTSVHRQGAKPGEVFPGLPPYKGNLFAVYTFTEGVLKNLQIGAGFEAAPGSYMLFAPKQGNAKTPGYATFSAMTSYTIDNITLSLNINNIFDKYYYQPTQTPAFIAVGQGRQILAQARMTF